MLWLEGIDVFRAILTEWLDVKDVVRFDTACTNHRSRESVLGLLKLLPLPFPYDDSELKYWKHHKRIIYWYVKKQLCHARGELKLGARLWDRMFAGLSIGSLNLSVDESIIFVRSLQRIRIESFHSSEFSFEHFEHCCSVRELTLCNLPVVINPTPQTSSALLPQLQSLHLNYCHINPALIQVLAGCLNLKDLHLIRPILSSGSLLPVASLVYTLLHRLSNLYVRGNIVLFLHEFGFTGVSEKVEWGRSRNLALRSLSFDHLFGDSEQLFSSLSVFLLHCPQLRKLTLAKSSMDILSLFTLIPSFHNFFEHLHINHCQLSRPSASEDFRRPLLPCTQDFFACKSLQFSSLLNLDDRLFQDTIILFTNNYLHTLCLSFCCGISDDSLQIISQNFPSLQLLQYEDERDLLLVQRVETIKTLFEHVPRVVIVEWDEWLSEEEKLRDPSSTLRNVLFEKG